MRRCWFTRRGHASGRSNRSKKRGPVGRNDPCPCGSGKKYKKCCIDMDRPLSAANDHGFPSAFRPESVPQLFDADATYEDIERLNRIMDRDPAFADIGFSAAEIGAFVDRVSKSEPALLSALTAGDPETSVPAVDDLAALFCRECPDADYGRSVIKDRFLDAAKRATSSNELRALTTGICLALMADPAHDALADILFRRALSSAIGKVSILDKIMDQLGGEDELRRLIAANDPSVTERLQSIADKLTASEADLLRTDFDMSYERLWDMIVANEFPVPPPFAAQMAMLGQIALRASGGKAPSNGDMLAAVEAFSRDLMEEDYVLYGQMLDDWLKESKERPGRIVEAVQLMRQLCMTRSIGDMAQSLFARTLQNARFAAFDEEEQKFIDSWLTTNDTSALAIEHGAWLRTKGYPGIADRLVRSWKGVDSFQTKLQNDERRIA
jgi:SEC-C motif